MYIKLYRVKCPVSDVLIFRPDARWISLPPLEAVPRRCKRDPTLSWRYSCRMGVCGSCGMLLNGRPTLACNTQILHIARTDLTVAPLPNFDIIRDLVPDLLTMFDKHRSLKPYIVRADEAEVNDPAGEFYQSPEDLEAYLQFTY